MNRNFRPRQALPQNLKSPLARQFKSPVCRTKSACSSSTPLEKESQVECLRKKLEEIKSEINALEKQGFKESELPEHIDKLHEYNEIKDVGVMVIGRIAVLEGVQSKDLYQRYGLDLND